MPNLSAGVAVIDSDKVLLIKRKDFEVWGLPGGMMDPGETIAQTAVRETFEETGIKVKLTRLVGIYCSPRWHHGGDNVVVFAGIPQNDQIKISPDEIVDAGYCSISQLPEPLIWWHRQRILDAIKGKKGIARLQDKIWPFDPEMRISDCRQMLEASQLSKYEFYLKHFAEVGPEGEKIEVE